MSKYLHLLKTCCIFTVLLIKKGEIKMEKVIETQKGSAYSKEDVLKMLEIVAYKQKVQSKKSDKISDRKLKLFAAVTEALKAASIPYNFRYCPGEKPATGASYSVRFVSGAFRINVRCGYGRFNYAPCLEFVIH